MPCLVFNRNIQHCHSAGRIYARPCNAIGRPLQKMHPKCIVRGTVGAARCFLERWRIVGEGAFHGGKPGKRRYLGMEQNLGCSSPPITAESPPTGDTDPSQKAEPNGGNTANYRRLPLFSSLHISHKLLIRKKHTWKEENILMSGSSMENMI